MRVIEEVNMEARNPNTTPLWDFVMPDPNAIASSIVKPKVEANNFKVNLAFITFQRNQLDGSPMKNPNDYITTFLENCDTIKINGVSDDAIWLRLFPFSLKDNAKSWLMNANVNSFTSWDILSKVFLYKYFALRKTV